jgi:hypothetical protein
VDKRVSDAREAVADIASGSTIAVGGFAVCGVPFVLIEALCASGATALEVVSNNCGVDEDRRNVSCQTAKDFWSSPEAKSTVRTSRDELVLREPSDLGVGAMEEALSRFWIEQIPDEDGSIETAAATSVLSLDAAHFSLGTLVGDDPLSCEEVSESGSGPLMGMQCSEGKAC